MSALLFVLGLNLGFLVGAWWAGRRRAEGFINAAADIAAKSYFAGVEVGRRYAPLERRNVPEARA